MSWALILTTWVVVNGAPTNVVIDPVRYYPTERICQTAAARTKVVINSPFQAKVSCIYNGAKNANT
jgi:hypothetical protein